MRTTATTPTTLKTPVYRCQKSRTGRDRAFVVINGKRIYLGAHNTPESQERYRSLIAEWLVSGDRAVQPPSVNPSVAELADAFDVHARRYYGTDSSEYSHFSTLVTMLVEHYGARFTADFAPPHLKAMQGAMVRRGWCRGNINKQVVRLRHIFKWGVGEGLVPGNVWQGLMAVPGLRRGRSDARQTPPIKPVPQAYIDAIQPFVSRQVWAMIELQLLTAARAGEITSMRPVDLDTTGKVWTYTPQQHKTAHHGHSRTIYLGPRAQEVIRPFLAGRVIDAFLFSPKEAEQERRTELHARRKTRLSRGNRPGTNRKSKPRRQPGEKYDVASYRRAIARGIELANRQRADQADRDGKEWESIPHWHPHQLRHNAATNLRKEFGIETARIICGHRSAAITEVYAELDHEKATEVIARIG